ncbi:hypothetical protein [Streptomyces hokutonensis]|uniref:hypothetical protein n=1 Tax=Streptomyces hokutonensis TaxID=1306990 RepID=UPI00382369F5
MAKALERVDDISAFHPGKVMVVKVPPNRLAVLARNGLESKAPTLERTPEPKRTALLTSVVRHLEAAAIDDALDLFMLLMQVKLISAAKLTTDKDWVTARPLLAKASRMLDGVFRLWSEQLDLVAESGADFDAGAMWRALETEIGPREEVMVASALLGNCSGPRVRSLTSRPSAPVVAGEVIDGAFGLVTGAESVPGSVTVTARVTACAPGGRPDGTPDSLAFTAGVGRR